MRSGLCIIKWLLFVYFTVAFRCFDYHSTGLLKHDDLFRMYKLMFKGALNDDQILDMVFRALDSPHLTRPGMVSQEDFFKVRGQSCLIPTLVIVILNGRVNMGCLIFA